MGSERTFRCLSTDGVPPILNTVEIKLFCFVVAYKLDGNKNAYFNFGVILYERRFALMF